MSSQDELERWRAVVSTLLKGPAPRGETFDLCRRLLVSGAPLADRREALRVLLEGAMADAQTEVDVAQDVMRMLKAHAVETIGLQALLTNR